MKKFFIIGYYGWNNTGDDAMLYVILQRLYSSNPDGEFVILSQCTVFTPPYIKSTKFVDSKDILNVLFEIMKSSVVILGGGTHLYDYGNKKNRIVRLSQMLVLLTFCKLSLKRIYFICIGAEPSNTKWGKFLIKHICKLADIIYVRDNLSYNVIEKYGLDPIRSFDLAAQLTFSKKCKNGDILGVSILPFYSIYYNDKVKDNIFICKISEGLKQWLNEDPEGLIYLFVFKGKSKDDDVFATEELLRLLGHERVKIIPYNPNPIEVLEKVSECTAFIGMRFHACVFAYISNIPLLIISYARKNDSLANDIGLDDCAILHLDNILKGEFNKYVEHLQRSPEKFMPSLSIDIAREKSYVWTNIFGGD